MNKVLLYSYDFLLKNSMEWRGFSFLCDYSGLFLSVERWDSIPTKMFPNLCVNLPLLLLKCPCNTLKLKYLNYCFESILKPSFGYAFVPAPSRRDCFFHMSESSLVPPMMISPTWSVWEGCRASNSTITAVFYDMNFHLPDQSLKMEQKGEDKH